MKGKELQQAVHLSGIRIAELERRTGIKERTIYSLYDKESVPQHYLKKLEDAGVKLQNTTSPDEANAFLKTVQEMISLMTLKEKIHLQDLELHRDQLNMIKADSEVFRNIVKKASTEGALVLTIPKRSSKD